MLFTDNVILLKFVITCKQIKSKLQSEPLNLLNKAPLFFPLQKWHTLGDSSSVLMTLWRWLYQHLVACPRDSDTLVSFKGLPQFMFSKQLQNLN